MGINLRVETIQTMLEDKIGCELFEEVCSVLDDIRILSDAKDVIIKEWAEKGSPESASSLNIQRVTHSEVTVCKHPHSQRRLSYNNRLQCGVCRQYL